METEIEMADNSTENEQASQMQKLTGFLALFSSTGTLLCCALPAAIAAVAGGAAVGAFISTFPWLISISHYKVWIFSAAFLLIVFSGILTFRPHGKLACSITGGHGCETAGRFSKIMFWISVIIYAIGFSFAYAIVPILRFLER
ncbi:hypothetical protein BMS3Abin05_01834 [bacterium BMS3Abin05]|nr:hypothetical protein BMS3Abin05_01834 [bacterium BMS3Abin05]GBE26091.1 hypothetical protein BMS3Bbin03_00002 [bacterium BMS3Bbin03]HDK35815.1 hypothetical protein [Bacteroidota bacterium]HDZ10712.1 hypothetical protein [Bacteroidota bacterium]